MSKNDKVDYVSGNFVLNDPNCIFIWGGSHDNPTLKVIAKDTVRSNDRFVYCDCCRTEFAIQVDGRYKEKSHSFTLCINCLNELNK